VTAQQLINRSLTLCGRLGAGRGAGESESEVSLGVLNAMLDTWRTSGLLVYAVRDDQYTLSPGDDPQQDYYIGPAAADFDTDRPTYIQAANVILDALDSSLKRPLDLVNAAKWSEIETIDDHSVRPRLLYNDYAWPVSRLRFWPIPSKEITLELFTWQAVTQLDSLGENVTLPPAYERAVTYNLALELGNVFELPVRELVAATAAAAKQEIASNNALRQQRPLPVEAAA